MANVYARLINQYKFKYHIFFLVAFIRLMKTIYEVVKLNCLLFRKLLIIEQNLILITLTVNLI